MRGPAACLHLVCVRGPFRKAMVFVGVGTTLEHYVLSTNLHRMGGLSQILSGGMLVGRNSARSNSSLARMRGGEH